MQLMQKILKESGLHTPSLREMEGYDAVLVLGEDVTQTGARIALAIRQAVKGKARDLAAAQRVADWQIAAVQTIGQHAKHPLFVTGVDKTRLDDVAMELLRQRGRAGAAGLRHCPRAGRVGTGSRHCARP